MKANEIVESARNVYSTEKYAMYLRKSRADIEMEALGEGETLARHKHMLEALAAKHNITLAQITIYKELVSGDSIDERPEMQKLLADVYAKKYKGVLVVEVERLARGNTKDQGEVADAFQASNTHIITPAKVYDPNNEFDQEYFEFGLFMSRREYKTIKRRLEAGKAQSVKEGNYILSQRIYGYNIERKSKKERILVPKPDEAEIVQMIFDWYTEDRKSTGWMAWKLTDMGIKTMTNRPEWNRGTIRDMLANVHYIGKVSWNKQSTVKVFDQDKGKLVKKRQYGQAEVYEGKHVGIISEEQFKKAQDIASITKSSAPVKNSAKLTSPLAGLLKCCDCGGHFVYMDFANSPSRSGGTVSRFQHPRKRKCKKKSLPVPTVMNALVEALQVYIEDFTMKMEADNDQTELIRHQKMIEAMEAELAKQEKMKRRLFDSWEADDGTYTKDEFIERKQIYTSTIERIKKQIQEAKTNAPAPVDYSEQIVNLHAMIDCINDPNLEAKAKNDFLKQFIECINYDVIDYGQKKGGKAILDVQLR